MTFHSLFEVLCHFYIAQQDFGIQNVEIRRNQQSFLFWERNI